MRNPESMQSTGPTREDDRVVQAWGGGHYEAAAIDMLNRGGEARWSSIQPVRARNWHDSAGTRAALSAETDFD